MHIDLSPLTQLQLHLSPAILRAANPYVRSKLRAARIRTLKEIFTFALEEEQQQKMRALDFKKKPEQINPIEINTVRNSTCYKCGKEGHSAKEYPQNHQQPLPHHTLRYTP